MAEESLESAVRKYCEGQFTIAEQFNEKNFAAEINYDIWLKLTNTFPVARPHVDKVALHNFYTAVQKVYFGEFAQKFKDLRLRLGESPDAVFFDSCE